MISKASSCLTLLLSISISVESSEGTNAVGGEFRDDAMDGSWFINTTNDRENPSTSPMIIDKTITESIRDDAMNGSWFINTTNDNENPSTSRMIIDKTITESIRSYPYSLRAVEAEFSYKAPVWLQIWSPSNQTTNNYLRYQLVWQKLLQPTRGRGSEVIPLSQSDWIDVLEGMEFGIIGSTIHRGPVQSVYSTYCSSRISVSHMNPLNIPDVGSYVEFDPLPFPHHLPITPCNKLDCSNVVIHGYREKSNSQLAKPDTRDTLFKNVEKEEIKELPDFLLITRDQNFLQTKQPEFTVAMETRDEDVISREYKPNEGSDNLTSDISFESSTLPRSFWIAVAPEKVEASYNESIQWIKYSPQSEFDVTSFSSVITLVDRHHMHKSETETNLTDQENEDEFVTLPVNSASNRSNVSTLEPSEEPTVDIHNGFDTLSWSTSSQIEYLNEEKSTLLHPTHVKSNSDDLSFHSSPSTPSTEDKQNKIENITGTYYNISESLEESVDDSLSLNESGDSFGLAAMEGDQRSIWDKKNPDNEDKGQVVLGLVVWNILLTILLLAVIAALIAAFTNIRNVRRHTTGSYTVNPPRRQRMDA